MDKYSTHAIVGERAYKEFVGAGSTTWSVDKDRMASPVWAELTNAGLGLPLGHAINTTAIETDVVQGHLNWVLPSLYPSQVDQHLRNARPILDVAIAAMKQGSRALTDGDRPECATALLEASARFDLAITFDEIDDPAALVLSSCSNALRNANFIDVSTEQIDTMIEIVGRWLTVEPYLTFERASLLVDELESQGLKTTPPSFPTLVELLTADDESVS